MAEVRLEHVNKAFGSGHPVVSDFNLKIQDQEFVVFVGPSGCGKTTTLRMIAGLETPTSGTIYIGDRNVTGLLPRERNIALVFQNYALYPHMTVFKNMAFALLQQRAPRAEIEQKVRSVAAMLQLEGLLERKPAQLSGGQRQRVALGRAIVRNPSAFLFDEPLSNLDAKLRVVTRAELKNLHRELRTTSIYVTHDQEEAMTLADRIVVMDNGVVQQIARPLEIYKRPSNRCVAGFLGMPPMNFVDGRLSMEADRAVFVARDFTIPLPARIEARAKAGEVVLGIRPEDLQLRLPGAPSPEDWLKGEVLVVEPLGSAMDVHIRTSAGLLTARVPSDETIQSGSPVTLALNAATLHVFEPGPYGANLTLT